MKIFVVTCDNPRIDLYNVDSSYVSKDMAIARRDYMNNEHLWDTWHIEELEVDMRLTTGKQLELIEKDEINHYLRVGVEVYYKWDKSEEWYKLSEESIRDVFEIISRNDYQFAIKKKDVQEAE